MLTRLFRVAFHLSCITWDYILGKQICCAHDSLYNMGLFVIWLGKKYRNSILEGNFINHIYWGKIFLFFIDVCKLQGMRLLKWSNKCEYRTLCSYGRCTDVGKRMWVSKHHQPASAPFPKPGKVIASLPEQGLRNKGVVRDLCSFRPWLTRREEQLCRQKEKWKTSETKRQRGLTHTFPKETDPVLWWWHFYKCRERQNKTCVH